MLPTLQPGALETWLLCAVGILSILALVKKVFLTKAPPEPEFVTKTEFHHALDAVRDKIDARSLTLGQKIDFMSRSIHHRLTKLESTVARLDERTKT